MRTIHPKIKKIADHYGLENQLTKMAEESAEYAAAVLKCRFYTDLVQTSRAKVKHFGPKADIAGEEMFKELADVMVLCRQIEYFMDTHPPFKTRIEELMDAKCNRQLRRIEEELAEGETK